MPEQKVTQAQLDKIKELRLPADEIATFLDTGKGPSEIEAADLAATGGPYYVGDLRVDPPTPDRFMLLQMIDSPLVSDSDGEIDIDLQEMMRALYVICIGREAVDPIVRHRRRMEQLEKLRSLAESKPELFEGYCRRVDQIAEDLIDFDKAAVEFWGQVGNISLQEAVDQVMTMVSEAFQPFQLIPDGDGEKKTHDSTPNGFIQSAESLPPNMGRIRNAFRRIGQWCGLDG